MMNIFRKNRKNNKENKSYKITKVFNLWANEYEDVDIITDSQGVTNMIVHGFDIIKIEEI